MQRAKSGAREDGKVRWRVGHESFADYYAAERYACTLRGDAASKALIKSYHYNACPDCTTHNGSCHNVCWWEAVA